MYFLILVMPADVDLHPLHLPTGTDRAVVATMEAISVI
jgi:hypothetical protein